MPDWSERVDQLLFDGEEVERRLEVGTATVAVTSHRVLAFTPQADGADYRAVDRPNVRGVERRQVSTLGLLPRAAKVGAIGGLLALVGVAVDTEALLPRPEVSDAPAAGGMVDTIDGVIGVFHALDTILLWLGVTLLVVAVGLVGLELATRRARVAIEVVGEEADVRLPGSVDDAEIEALEDAIAAPPDGNPNPESAATSDPATEATTRPKSGPPSDPETESTAGARSADPE